MRLGGWETERPDAWREVVLTAIPKKSDKVGFRSMRYISLLPVIQKFYIRALQSAVRRERKPHETNIFGCEPGRSTAGVTATLRQVLFVLNPSALFCANPVISRVELICLVPRCRLLFCALVMLDREACKALMCGIRYWTTHSESLQVAGKRREGFMLARDYRKAQKRRRGSSGDAVKDEGQVLHHLCWADDLYAMAGTMNHLTRILEDMTNAIERLGMRWKEKSLAIVAGPFTEYKRGDVVEIISNSGIRWIWRVVEGMEALGTWLDNRGCTGSPRQTPCFTRRRLCSVIPKCQ